MTTPQGFPPGRPEHGERSDQTAQLPAHQTGSYAPPPGGPGGPGDPGGPSHGGGARGGQGPASPGGSGRADATGGRGQGGFGGPRGPEGPGGPGGSARQGNLGNPGGPGNTSGPGGPGSPGFGQSGYGGPSAGPSFAPGAGPSFGPGPNQFGAPRESGHPRARSTTAIWTLGLLSLALVVLGLSIPEDGHNAWHTVHAWGALAILGSLLTLAPVALNANLGGPRAWQLSACGAGALVLYWVLFVLPDAGSNTSLALTVGAVLGVIATWVAPGRESGLDLGGPSGQSAGPGGQVTPGHGGPGAPGWSAGPQPPHSW